MITHFLFDNKLINDKTFKKLIKYYVKNDNWHEIDLKKISLGYGLMHYSLIRINKPKRVLCIGSKYGFIPAICALACRHNDYGQVDFVDAGYDQANLSKKQQHWGGIGLWATKKGMKHFNKLGLKNFINLHVVTSSHFASKNKNLKFNYIYIDGDHSYKGVKKDYQVYWPKLLKNGFMLFHDIHVKKIDNTDYGVQKLWQELIKKHPNKLELSGKYGLGLIQKI